MSMTATALATTTFPPRLGHPAYSASYSTLSSLTTTFTDEAAPTKYSMIASELISQDKIGRKLQGVFCATKDCLGSSDWLVKVPTPAAAWVVGALSLVAGIWLLALAARWKSKTFVSGFGAMVLLAVSMFLRAALGSVASGTRQVAMYRASLFFNYFSGATLVSLIVVLVVRLAAHFNPRTGLKHWVIASVSPTYSCAALALLAAGVTLQFDDKSTVSDSSMSRIGTRLVQSMLALTLAVLFGMSVWIGKIAKKQGAQYLSRQLTIGFASVGLLLLWAAFMFARTFVELDNAARSSEIMFYLLNVVPLIFVVITAALLNAPLALNFQMTASWKWVK
ncbi:hypothetical protein IW150_000613 [Coemansia sp. RSA 2607]|nr:hypothetical protein IW150_000613 [Coemansia sp. RSA 2607]